MELLICFFLVAVLTMATAKGIVVLHNHIPPHKVPNWLRKAYRILES